MSLSRDTARAVLLLDWLSDHAEGLAESRRPGTKRPRTQQRLSPEQLARLDALARQERADRAGEALPAVPAPCDVSLLDLSVELLDQASDLAEQVAQAAGVERLPTPNSAYLDPRPYLKYSSIWLESAVLADPDLAATAADVASRLTRRVSAALGLLTDGQSLSAACPFCGGRDERHPVGGAHTLVVRMMPHLRDEHGFELPAIVCFGDNCEPSSADCGRWWNGHPVWLPFEWEWLAERIEWAAQEIA